MDSGCTPCAAAQGRIAIRRWPLSARREPRLPGKCGCLWRFAVGRVVVMLHMPVAAFGILPVHGGRALRASITYHSASKHLMRRLFHLLCCALGLYFSVSIRPTHADAIHFNTDSGVMSINGNATTDSFGVNVRSSVVRWPAAVSLSGWRDVHFFGHRDGQRLAAALAVGRG